MENTIAFRINQNCFDRQSKDIVTITNGTTEQDGKFMPTEAMALRVVGFDRRRPVIAYTYIRVRPENLIVAKDQIPFCPDDNCLKTLFIGRV